MILPGIETTTELIFQDTDASKTWELRTCSKYPVDKYIQATSTLIWLQYFVNVKSLKSDDTRRDEGWTKCHIPGT